MFINFLVNLLHLEESEQGVLYVGWYSQAGTLIGILIPILTSLLFVILFYYVWSRFRATTTFHWFLTGFINMLTAFVLTLFIGRSALALYIDTELGADGEEIWYTVTTWPFTLDLWIFSANAVLWCLLFFFLFSWVLKRWSPVFNIPFGRKYKKAIN